MNKSVVLRLLFSIFRLTSYYSSLFSLAHLSFHGCSCLFSMLRMWDPSPFASDSSAKLTKNTTYCALSWSSCFIRYLADPEIHIFSTGISDVRDSHIINLWKVLSRSIIIIILMVFIDPYVSGTMLITLQALFHWIITTKLGEGLLSCLPDGSQGPQQLTSLLKVTMDSLGRTQECPIPKPVLSINAQFYTLVTRRVIQGPTLSG